MQAACKAATAPAILRAINESSTYDVLAAPTISSQGAAPQRSGLSQCKLLGSNAAPPARVASAPVFNRIKLGTFQRIYMSENLDSYLISVCVLIATVATGAVLARLVTAYCGNVRTRGSLQREIAYEAAFLPRMRCNRCSPRAAALCCIAFVAALVWAAAESGWIFLSLSAPADVRFGLRLEHVVVDMPINLGPEGGDRCRTIEWQADNIDMEQRLRISRCFSSAAITPGTDLGYTVPDNGANLLNFVVAFDTADGDMTLSVPPIETEPGATASMETRVFRPSSPVSLPVDTALDPVALLPYFEAALSEARCPLVLGGPRVCEPINGKTASLWQAQCSPKTMAKKVFFVLQKVVRNHVDLRVAEVQGSAGFAGSLGARDEGSAASGALRAELHGDAVVGRVKTPRANLVAALIIAAGAVVVYLLAQIGGRSAAELALDHVDRQGIRVQSLTGAVPKRAEYSDMNEAELPGPPVSGLYCPSV